MSRDPAGEGLDYRFTLANERTFLAWVRTAVALIAGGVVAAKALDFESELWRWVVAAPPLVGGVAMAIRGRSRWRSYDAAMRAGRPLPARSDGSLLAFLLAAYAVLALIAIALD